MPITPSGRYLGRKPDSGDPRDKRFGAVHAASLVAPPPPRVSLRDQLPPCFDQGAESSCGPNSGTAMMAHQFPELPRKLFSRNQVYWSVRDLQGDTALDDGVETRNVLKVLTKVGAALETSWEYGNSTLFRAPPPSVLDEAKQFQLLSYSRLSSDSEYMACLADGYTFILGFTCYESIDGTQIARTGVMHMPDPTREKVVGGHDVLVVGYDTDFRNSDVFRRSGLAPDQVEDTMLEIRNSWGAGWGDNGHFWMPMSFAVNPSVAGDAWTGRRYAPAEPMMADPVQRQLTQHQLVAGTQAAREYANGTMYGGFISDDQCRDIASTVGMAVINT